VPELRRREIAAQKRRELSSKAPTAAARLHSACAGRDDGENQQSDEQKPGQQSSFTTVEAATDVFSHFDQPALMETARGMESARVPALSVPMYTSAGKWISL